MVPPPEESDACPISPTSFPASARNGSTRRQGRIFARVGGKGPPLLLLHGFSETHVMWHRVAPQLADKFSLIIADLPGYGWSDMPDSDKEHTPYTKRAMAQDHGRGDGAARPRAFRARRPRPRRPRVAYRLALDHPGRLSKLAVLDILPTYDYWERMNRALCAEDLSLDVPGAAASVAGDADRWAIRISSSN